MIDKDENLFYDTMYQEVTPTTVEDIIRLHDKLGNYVFRGQAGYKWSLITTFERAAASVSPDKRKKLEQKIILEFKRRAQHYLDDLPEKDKHLEWLALMQHHGCPTRLLDFTHSYYIALFFAVEETCTDSSVWAVNRKFFEDRTGIPTGDDCLYSEYSEQVEDNIDSILAPSTVEAKDSSILIGEPYRMNERLSIQQGLFLFPKNLQVSFEENLCSRFGAKSLNDIAQKKSTPVVLKIIIPTKLHLNIALYLSAMNISAATLFPGLDGYARSQKLHIKSAEFSIRNQRRFSLNLSKLFLKRNKGE